MSVSPQSDPGVDPIELMRRINRCWLEGRPQDLRPLFDPDIVMAYPGFVGYSQGRDALIAGFVDFCKNARIHEFTESDHRVDVFGDTAVAGYAFEMVYELERRRHRSTGRDLWVFGRRQGSWVAVWRTMLDTTETELT